MYLSTEKVGLARDLITTLYARPFSEALVLEAAQSLCRIVDAHYFSLFRAPLRKRSVPLRIGNNPPEYGPAYDSVAREDFLLHHVVTTHGECVLHQTPQSDPSYPEDQNFIQTVQSARPISDHFYAPITMHRMLIGVWGLARAGLKSPIYTENDLDVIRFITGFLSDAFTRSLVPPPVEEDAAYLDYQGHIVQSGVKIQETFDTLFGPDDLGTVFKDSYRNFLHGPFKVGMDRVTLHAQNATYSFLFTLLRPGGIPFRLEGIPYASVRLLDLAALERVSHVLDWPALSGIYSLTTREDQVLAGIFKGHSNKMIAYRLGIDEGTVKYYTYKIFEKTGLHSRTELVLNLSPAKKPN